MFSGVSWRFYTKYRKIGVPMIKKSWIMHYFIIVCIILDCSIIKYLIFKCLRNVSLFFFDRMYLVVLFCISKVNCVPFINLTLWCSLLKGTLFKSTLFILTKFLFLIFRCYYFHESFCLCSLFRQCILLP